MMLTSSTFDPIKVVLDLFQDYFGLAFTKALSEPFGWVAVALAGIAGLARRDNVIGRITATGGNRDKMFLRQNGGFIPKKWRIPAVGADAMPILKTISPMGVVESSNKRPFAIPAFLDFSTRFIRMGFGPARIGCVRSVFVSLLPSANCLHRFARVSSFPLLAKRIHSAGVFVVPSLRLGATASKTMLFYAIGLLLVFDEEVSGKPNATDSADAANRGWKIKHRNLLSLHLGVEGGPAPRNAVVRRVINPSQAHWKYIEDQQVAQCL